MIIVLNVFLPAKIGDLERKIRIGAVSYLNAKPLLYGLPKSACFRDMELITDYPSRIARMLLDDQIDMGLVPVAVIPLLENWYINTDFCIGANGEVASVCLFSDTELADVRKVLLDYQSRTSVALTKVLLKNYWKLHPQLEDAGAEDYRTRIKGDTAGLVIGDRALEQRKHSRYIYDLATAWKSHTGLPFVFAAWISNKPIAPDFIKAFNEANETGLGQIETIVKENPYEAFDLEKYYKECVSYRLDEQKKKGLEEFLRQYKDIV